MARALIRCISCFKIPPFSLSLPPFPFYCYSSCPSLSFTHQIVSYLNQCLTRTHFYQIHAQLVTSSRLQNPFLGSKLLKLSSQFEDLRYTSLIFQSIRFPDIVCANTAIKAYSTSSLPQQGVIFYFEMMKCGVFPNSFTFPPLIGCCAVVGSARTGEMCHGQAIKNGFDGVVQIQNSLIHMYACCGLIEVALDVFDAMLERDLVSWNSIINGYLTMGDLRTTHKLFDVMPEKNVVSWNVMMTGYLNDNNPGFVLKLFREMVRKELSGNSTTMVNVLVACGRSARVKEGASVHGFLVRSLWNLSLIMKTSLIDMYSKCQKVKVARSVFDRLLEKNLVCWNSMILGHCLHGNPEDGLHLFEDMISSTKLDGEVELVHSGRSQTLLPDEITFVGILCACTRAGMLARGRSYFHQMVNLFGIRPNFAHYWCLANLLASKGLVQEALETVKNLNEFIPDMSSQSLVWASFLGSCRFQGDTSLAEQVANALIQVEPQNAMCYALLFNIYAAAAKWDDAAEVKILMKKKVAGKMAGCSLVDLIGIVHNFRVEKGNQCGMEIVINSLAGKINLPMPKTECQT